MQKTTLKTGIITTIKKNRIEVQMPSVENRSNKFKELIKLCV